MVTIIKELCTRNGTNIKAVEDACGLSNASIRRWDDSWPSIDKVLAVAQHFGVSLEYLLGIDTPIQRSDFDRKYSALDDHGRELVSSVLDIEYSRCVNTIKVQNKIVPLFPAAAGPGEPVDGEVFEEYEIPADSKADFAVRISGDSMEPELHHGEVVLCQKRRPSDGDIAVMLVNGCLVVKQYVEAFGNIYLRSINRQRKSQDIDILASGNYTVQGWGTVIHKRIPLVEQ